MSNNFLLYFWINGELKTHPNVVTAKVPKEYRGAYCLDSIAISSDCRYGRYEENIDWVHVPLSRFPAEFRLILLTLGVT